MDDDARTLAPPDPEAAPAAPDDAPPGADGAVAAPESARLRMLADFAEQRAKCRAAALAALVGVLSHRSAEPVPAADTEHAAAPAPPTTRRRCRRTWPSGGTEWQRPSAPLLPSARTRLRRADRHRSRHSRP